MMLKIWLLILLLIGSVGVIACTNTKDGMSFMYTEFDSITSLQDLSSHLVANGYKWASDGANLTPWTDFHTKPVITWERKWGNCNDYTALFCEFARYKASKGIRAADGFHEIYLYKRLANIKYGWHYICVFRVGDKFFEQSNLSVREVSGWAESIAYWGNTMGYDKQRVIRTWEADPQ